MSNTLNECLRIQPDLVASATGDAEPDAARRVGEHVRACAPCREELEQYRAIDRVIGDLRPTPVSDSELAILREELATGLADLRRRLVRYRIFRSPLGRILIATSEAGVVLVEYLGGRGDPTASRLDRIRGMEPVEGGAEIDDLYRDLLGYLGGATRRLGWPLDLRLARSEFHREVLEATAALPYGAVTSYARIARQIGKPDAVRAVAQALRWNPLPIVVPCHRVVGASGALAGYAGDRPAIKERLLGIEGVLLERDRREAHVARDRMYARPGREQEYCLPTCGSIPSLTLARLTLFASRESAETVGLRPCTSCRPDLHPISR